MRTPILAANWKMHKTRAEAAEFVAALLPLVKDVERVEVVLAPPFTVLCRVAKLLEGSAVALAAQNVHPEPGGAFTGEISAPMLADLGCRYAIVGHSERRSLFAESDAFVARKARALLESGIRPIVCVGESLEEREADQTFDVIGSQLDGSLAAAPDDRIRDIVLAYEPIWAIGTGRTATPELAQDVHAFIRDKLAQRFGADAAQQMRIQYGGSVKPENVDALLAQPDIDGALVGGASLDAQAFARIVRFESQES
ncbi:MAG: triose-phosphate isomerase [Myxococcales bacterium]|nr:triose-phosphate isomerase [Myxococcales bacterium]MDH5567644.1 triose-phosphate isomerase [Myxococcales bacterium]